MLFSSSHDYVRFRFVTSNSPGLPCLQIEVGCWNTVVLRNFNLFNLISTPSGSRNWILTWLCLVAGGWFLKMLRLIEWLLDLMLICWHGYVLRRRAVWLQNYQFQFLISGESEINDFGLKGEANDFCEGGRGGESEISMFNSKNWKLNWLKN